jgi:hypothetical protein
LAALKSSRTCGESMLFWAQHARHPRDAVSSNIFRGLQVRNVRILLLILWAWFSDTGLAQLSDLLPRPELSPEQVVLYQVDSLRQNQARVVVRIVAADGRRVTYVFVLSRQGEGDFNNCWMTDGVAPLNQEEDASAEGVTI